MPCELGDVLDVHRGAGIDVVGGPLLGDAPGAQDLHGIGDPLEPDAGAILRGKTERGAKGLASRNDGDLVQRVGVIEQCLEHGVAGLVVGGAAVVVILAFAGFLGPAETHLVAGFLEVLLFDEILFGHGRGDGGLVDDRGQVGAREHGRGAGEAFEIGVRAELDPLGVDPQDLGATDDIGKVDADGSVESAGADEGGVEDIGAVGGGDDDHAVRRREAVHLDQDRVERLLTLVVAAAGEAAATLAADSVNLVQEDDARCGLLGLLEEVADARGTHAHEHLDKVRAGDGEEGHVGLACDRLGQQRFAAPGRAGEKHASRDAPAELGEPLGIFEELDDLVHLVLGLIDAGDVIEGDAGHLLAEHAVSALPEVAEHTAAAAGVAQPARDEEPEHEHDENERAEGEHDRPDLGRLSRADCVAGDLRDLGGDVLARVHVEVDANDGFVLAVGPGQARGDDLRASDLDALGLDEPGVPEVLELGERDGLGAVGLREKGVQERDQQDDHDHAEDPAALRNVGRGLALARTVVAVAVVARAL